MESHLSIILPVGHLSFVCNLHKLLHVIFLIYLHKTFMFFRQCKLPVIPNRTNIHISQGSRPAAKISEKKKTMICYWRCVILDICIGHFMENHTHQYILLVNYLASKLEMYHMMSKLVVYRSNWRFSMSLASF